MNSETIIKEIKKYLENDRLNYAVLIDGEWGTGKTFFIKNTLIPLLTKDVSKNHFFKSIFLKIMTFFNIKILKKTNFDVKKIQKKPIYISLYGLESVEDISLQIYLKASGKISGIVSFGASVLRVFKINFNYSEIINELNNKFHLDDYILIFDDLERINMDINVCLSYINSFVEHQNIKTIIVANEKELEKINFDKNYELKVLSSMMKDINYDDEIKKDITGKEKKEEFPSLQTIEERISKIYNFDNKYKKIKEKLIGDTIHYIPDEDKIIDMLINQYKDEFEYMFFLKKNKSTLTLNLKIYSCLNIRIIKSILEGFHDLYLCINKLNIKTKDTILNLIYNNYIIYMINLKQGKSKLIWNTSDLYEQAASFENDDKMEFSKFFVSFRFVETYIFEREIDEKEIENVLSDYIDNCQDEKFDQNLSYNKLREYWFLEDDEISILLNTLKTEIKNDNYPIKIYPKIILTLSYIENLNYEVNVINDILKQMQENINNKNYQFDFFDLRAYFVSDENVLKIYNNHIKKIKINGEKISEKKHKTAIDDIFESPNWGIELNSYVNDTYNNNKILSNKEFFATLNVDTIIDLISKSNSKNIYYFKYALDHVYRFSNIKDYYINDKKNIELFREKIEKLNIKNCGVTKKEAIKYLKDKVTEINELLK